MSEQLRLLTPADLEDCMRLKEAAGWNQTAADWLRLMLLEPDGVWGIEVEGTVAASGSVVRYGDRLSWVGMILTLPEFRRRGYARTILEHLLKLPQARDVDWVKLDGTDQGQPLYEQLGFQVEAAIERWQRSGTTPPAETLAAPALDSSPGMALDRKAFGADRRSLLSRLKGEGVCRALPSGGFAMARPGSRAAFLGPCVAESPQEAERLILWMLEALREQPVYWDLLPGNGNAAAWARQFGFEPVRRLVRMGPSDGRRR